MTEVIVTSAWSHVLNLVTVRCLGLILRLSVSQSSSGDGAMLWSQRMLSPCDDQSCDFGTAESSWASQSPMQTSQSRLCFVCFNKSAEAKQSVAETKPGVVEAKPGVVETKQEQQNETMYVVKQGRRARCSETRDGRRLRAHHRDSDQ